MQSLVSIIIPYYNRPKKLERSLDSIFSQTYTNYEIIVVDDCSTISYQDIHKNVKYFRNDTNSGPGVSRNKGMQHAKGELIAFLDCDDYWHADFLSKLVETLSNNPNACMAYSNGVNVDENNKIIGTRRKKAIYPTTILPNILFNGRRWGTGGCLWRKSSIGDVKWLENRSWEDYAFDISVGINNNEVIPIKENLVFYDASGDDKLSKKNEINLIIEKHKSINAISKLLLQNQYKKDFVVNKSITILIILNTVKFIKHDIPGQFYITANLKSIKKWRNMRFYLYMLLLCQLPKRARMKYLKMLKRKVNQNRIYFLR